LLYAVCLLRRVANAFAWLTAAIGLLVIVGPATRSFDGPYSLQAWPLVLLAVLQLGAAVRYRSGAHSMTAALCAIAAACIFWPQELAMRWGGAIPAHLALLAMMLIGAVLHDRAARFLQKAAFAAILLFSIFVMSGGADDLSHTPRVLLTIYPGIMLLVAAAYGALLCKPWYWGSSLLFFLVWIVAIGYRAARESVAGLDQIAAGMACLLVGFLVSLWKLGMPQAWIKRWFKPPGVALAVTSGNAENDPGDATS
jgi:hypothetical protein